MSNRWYLLSWLLYISMLKNSGTLGPKVIKRFSCSTKLSMKFQLLIKTKIWTNYEVSHFKPLRCYIYHAYKCWNANNCWQFNIHEHDIFELSWVEHEKSFITSRPLLPDALYQWSSNIPQEKMLEMIATVLFCCYFHGKHAEYERHAKTCRFHISCISFKVNTYSATIILSWKCLLIMSAALFQMHTSMLSSWKPTLWTLIRLLLREQSDLGPFCLQYRLSK